MQTTKEIGDFGEDLAARYLGQKGYEIVERNFRTRFGEIDIIAKDREVLVFVEVKKKASDRFGTAAEMITKKKIGRIRRAAEFYLLENGLRDQTWQIDAILIDGSSVVHLGAIE